MKIGIDVDQVLAGFAFAFATHARSKGIIVSWPITSWGFGLKKKDLKELMDDVYTNGQDSGFWANLPVLLTNNEMFLLQNVCNEHEVYFITTRLWKDSQQITAKWLQEKLGVSAPSVIITHHKGVLADALLLDRHLDDNVWNAFEIARSQYTKSYLLKTSYTEAFPEYHLLPEVRKKVTEVKTVAEYLQSVI